MEKAELVFIPSPGIGHLVSTIEFANLLLERYERLSIIVLVMNAGKENKTKLSSHANIRFIELPYVEPPPIESMSKSMGKYISDSVESHRTCVKDAIVNHVLPNSPKLLGLVVDFFCTSMIDVANEIGLPSYIFFTSSAAFLSLILYLPHLPDQAGRELEEAESGLIIPSFFNPVPANVLPGFVLKKGDGYTCFVNHGRRFKETKGILINTFLDLESYVFSSLSTYGLPPVYTVGPLINHKNQNSTQSNNQGQHDEIMRWLDDQPPSSVVFLCFGSRGCFGVPQLKEIALGLERSGHRFLWSMRVASKEANVSVPSESVDMEATLPEGFLERTTEKGLVCGWAPQVEVLAHRAVGGFVSHCGWNSILESLWFGVPILAWPLYAEQQFNAFQIVKDLELAFGLKLESRRYNDDIVNSDKISKAVKCLMEEDSEVRKRVKDLSLKSRKAVIANGTSYSSVGDWIETMLANN